jgi:hypothetical protein
LIEGKDPHRPRRDRFSTKFGPDSGTGRGTGRGTQEWLSPPKRTGEGERSGAGLDGLTLPKFRAAEEWARVAREAERDLPVGRDTLFQ